MTLVSLNGNINTSGVIPFEYKNKLFIIEGNVVGSMFPEIYGKVHTYEKFSWGKIVRIPEEECKKMAKENDHLSVSEEVEKQFQQILGSNS